MASLRLIHRSIRLNHPHTSRSFASTTSYTRTYAYVAIFALTAGVGVTYYLDSRAAIHRYLITPIIRHALDPETGHKLAVSVLESGLGPRDMLTDDERLKTEVKPSVPRAGNGLSHRTCSSGVKHCRILSVSQQALTKTAELLMVRIACLIPPCTHTALGLFNLGFSWVEVGSVTPKPQVSVRSVVLHTYRHIKT